MAEQAALLHAHLDAQGARRGDVVLTLLGNRPEWVLAMVACFRYVLPCTEQLRPKDLRMRLGVDRGEAGDRRRAQPRRARGGRLGRPHHVGAMGAPAGR